MQFAEYKQYKMHLMQFKWYHGIDDFLSNFKEFAGINSVQLPYMKRAYFKEDRRIKYAQFIALIKINGKT